MLCKLCDSLNWVRRMAKGQWSHFRNDRSVLMQSSSLGILDTLFYCLTSCHWLYTFINTTSVSKLFELCDSLNWVRRMAKRSNFRNDQSLATQTGLNQLPHFTGLITQLSCLLLLVLGFLKLHNCFKAPRVVRYAKLSEEDGKRSTEPFCQFPVWNSSHTMSRHEDVSSQLRFVTISNDGMDKQFFLL